MKKIKTLSVGLSVLFLLSCENKQDANKPEKPKVETEKTSTDNSEKSHENHLQKQIVYLIASGMWLWNLKNGKNI